MALVPQDDWYAIIDLVTQSVDSPHSKRAYSRALIDFLDWYEQNGRPGFSKATINAYREEMLRAGKSRSSINQALSAIRKLASEAADNGLVPPTLAYGVERVKGVKQEGVRAGNWLTHTEAQLLINTPIYRWQREEIPLLKAVRDQAVLAMLIGTGLRRAELADLAWSKIQQRDGRWAIIDLIGKRGRVRSVGIPPWVKQSLDQWWQAAGWGPEGENGRIFLALNKDGQPAGRVRTKNGYLTDGYLTAQAIYNIVKEHVTASGFVNQSGEATIAAHDLRRTAAALALKGGADLRQIQQMLGHASITTTERYLEPMRSLQVTAGDFIQIELAVANAN
jgi:site-specific recombinase XerD